MSAILRLYVVGQGLLGICWKSRQSQYPQASNHDLLWWSGSHQQWPEPILLKAAKKLLHPSPRSCNTYLSSLCTSVGHIADGCKQSGARQTSMHQHFLWYPLCTGFGQRKGIQEDSSRVSSKYMNAGTVFGAQDHEAISCPAAQASISALVDLVPIISDQPATSTCLRYQQGDGGSSTQLHLVRITFSWHPVFSSVR